MERLEKIREKATHPLEIWLLNVIIDSGDCAIEEDADMVVEAELHETRAGHGWIIDCACNALPEIASDILQHYDRIKQEEQNDKTQ